MSRNQPCPLTPPISPSRAKHSIAIGSLDVLVPGISLLTLHLDMKLPEKDLAEANSAVERESVEKKKPKKGSRWQIPKKPRVYLGRYQLVESPSSGYQVYGYGVWSTVYRAVEITDHNPRSTTTTTSLTNITTPPLTPPTSPSSSPVLRSLRSLLAIKTPSSHSAHAILKKEACILTYLSSLLNPTNHLVAFHGYDFPQSSLVLEAVPLSLESHAIAAAKAARLNLSTKNMFDPVVGTVQWAHLAIKLIDGLAFLHSARCVHGDIKPANILLRPSSTFPFPSPLYCDFSSSHIGHPLCTTTSSRAVAATGEDSHDADDKFSSSKDEEEGYYEDNNDDNDDEHDCDEDEDDDDDDDDDHEADDSNNSKKQKEKDIRKEGEEVETVSAVTPDYTSPELLAALRLGKATATQASDVFALATTLVMVAIGQSPYSAGGRLEVLKLAMAREGRPMDFARGGENASRVMRGKLVDKVVKGGLMRDVDGRDSVWEWRDGVGGLLKEVLEV